MTAKQPRIARREQLSPELLEPIRKLSSKLEKACERMSFEECAQELSRLEWAGFKSISDLGGKDDSEVYGALFDNFTLKGLQHFLAKLQLLGKLIYEELPEAEHCEQRDVLSIEAKEKLSAVMGALYMSEALFDRIKPSIKEEDSVDTILVEHLKEALDVALCLMGDDGDQSLETVLGFGSDDMDMQKMYAKYRDEHREIMAQSAKARRDREEAA